VRHPRQYAIDTFHLILLFQLHEENGPAAWWPWDPSHVRCPFYIGGVGLQRALLCYSASRFWLLAKVKSPTSRKRRETWGTRIPSAARTKAGSSPALSRWFGMTGVWGGGCLMRCGPIHLGRLDSRGRLSLHVPFLRAYPGLRPGLFSVAPTGLWCCCEKRVLRHCGRGTSHVRRPFYIGGVGLQRARSCYSASRSWLLTKSKAPRLAEDARHGAPFYFWLRQKQVPHRRFRAGSE
jgi:hypothetical protein